MPHVHVNVQTSKYVTICCFRFNCRLLRMLDFRLVKQEQFFVVISSVFSQNCPINVLFIADTIFFFQIQEYVILISILITQCSQEAARCVWYTEVVTSYKRECFAAAALWFTHTEREGLAAKLAHCHCPRPNQSRWRLPQGNTLCFRSAPGNSLTLAFWKRASWYVG